MRGSQRESVSRARWAAIGAAIAVSFGVGGVAVTNAVVSIGEKAAFVPIAPGRLFDMRPAPDNVGPRATPLGPNGTYTQPVRGANGDCDIPTDATAVAMNVTTVGGTADSYLTVYPSDVNPRPLASNLNWVAGAPPTPNKVDVKLSADGKVNLFNFTGSVFVLADVVGYYADHNHDDRYYTKAEIDANNYTKAQIDANNYTKSQIDANNYTKSQIDANYYTKAEIDAKLSADITINNGLGFLGNPNYGPSVLGYFGDVTRATVNAGGLTILQLPLVGPKSIAGLTFRFSSMTYCIKAAGAPAFIDLVSVGSTAPPPPVSSVGDGTDRTAAGCYTVSDPTGTLAASTSILMGLSISGTTGYIEFTSVTSTWTPVLA